MAEKDRDTATAIMLDHKESEEKEHTELNAKITEMRTNYLLLISQVQSKDAEIAKLTLAIDSKDVEIAELNANTKELDNKLAQVHARAITSAPTIARIDENKETELLRGSSCESTLPSPSSSALTIPAAHKSPERSLSVLKEKDQIISKLLEEIQQLRTQQMKSSGGTGVDDVCAEPTQSGVS